jgi:hypothetical protein
MRKIKVSIFFWTTIFLTCFATDAFAIAAPAVGSFGYTLYDIVVEQGLKGAFGYIGGVVGVITGAICLYRNMVVQGIGPIVGGGALIEADEIVETLGMTIDTLLAMV